MTTYLLNWNPKRWEWYSIEDDIAYLQENGWLDDRWSCGVNKSIQPGDRFFLIRLGREPRGIVGSGRIRSAPFEELHWDDERAKLDQTARYVDVVFDSLVNAEIDPLLPIDFLKDHPVLGRMHWSQQASGVRIPDEIAAELTKQWSRLLDFASLSEDEALSVLPGFVEGAIRETTLTRFERNRSARQICINHYGAECVLCGFSFEREYGPTGSGYIHVHHIVPLSEIGESYEVDPIRDLRPVCPNCHAIIHRRKPAYTLDEVKSFLRSGSLQQDR